MLLQSGTLVTQLFQHIHHASASPQARTPKTHGVHAGYGFNNPSRLADATFDLEWKYGPVVGQRKDRVAQRFMDQSMATGFMARVPDCQNRSWIMFSRMPCPKVSRTDLLPLHDFKKTGGAVQHPLIIAGKGTDIGFHIDSQHDIKCSSHK